MMKIYCKKRKNAKTGEAESRKVNFRAKQYCEETSLHGFQYLTKPSNGVKCFWCFVCLTCMILCVLSIYNQIIRYQENRVTTTIQTTNYPIGKVPFPAVTICNNNLIYKNHTEEVVKILGNHGIPEETITNYFLNLSYAILNRNTYENFDRHDYIQITNILQANDFNTEGLMNTLAQPCSNMLIKCEWQTLEFDCKKLFKKTKSSRGFCCSFNHNGMSFLTDDPTDDMRNIYVGGLGNAYGLKVYLDAEQFQYITTESVGFSVLAHNSMDYPDVLVYGIPLELNTHTSLAVRASVITSREKIRNIDVDTRDCIYTGEVPIPWSKEYTYENCLKQCKQKLIWRYCKCVPFYYYVPTSRYCSILDVLCVKRAERAFVILQNGKYDKGASKENFSCKCRSSCNEILYSSMIQGEQLISTNSLDPAMNISVLSVYFENSGVIQFTRNELSSWDSLLASVGGIFGLFLGGSIMSIIEFFYHLISGIFKYRIRSCNLKHTLDERHHPKIFRSELYPRSYVENKMSDNTTPLKWKL